MRHGQRWMASSILGLAALLVLNSGCVTFQVKRDRVERVKSVAIVGYDGLLTYQWQTKKSGVAGSVNEIVSENQADEIERGRVSLAEDSYDLLAKMLGENFGWSVVSREQLLAHPTYHELYQQRMRGMWTPHLANTRGDSVLAPGILPAGIMRYLGPAERQALAQDLGVDAVAIIEVSYVVGDKSGFAVGDIGSETYYPAARSYLLLYDGSGEEPIWCDPGAMGAPASEGFQHIMGVNKWADMPKILFETTQSSFAQLLSRYKTYHGEE